MEARDRAHRRAACAALGMALVVSVTACGGGDAASASADIPIALLEPTSGVWATQGTNSVQGADLAFADINEAGGVLDGRMIVARQADAGNDPQTAASAARRLLEEEGIAAIVGTYLSSYTLTATTVAEQAGVPEVTQSFSDELVTRDYRYTFKTTPTAAGFSESLFAYLTGMYEAEGRPLPTVAILASDDASGQQQYEAAVAAAPEAGFTSVLSEQFPANLTDTNALVNRIVDAAPELLLLNGPDLPQIQIVQALRARGQDIPIVGLGGAGVTTQGFVDALGDDVDGVLATVAWNQDLNEETAALAERYLAEHEGTFMPAEAGTAYIGTSIVARAIEDAGSAEPEAVAEALRSLDLSDGPAALMPGGRIAFDDTGLNTESFPLMIQYQDGTPVTVWPQDVATSDPVL